MLKKNLLCLVLAMVLALSGAGCVGAQAESSGELTTLTLYVNNATNPSGPLTGWAADFFAQYGLALEFQPVSAERTSAILASGDLGADIVSLELANMVIASEAGMLLDMSSYLDQMPNVTEIGAEAIQFMRDFYSNGTNAVYGIPTGITQDGVYSAPGRQALFLLWQPYSMIGCPEFSTFEDLIPVLKQMQEAYPTNGDGLNVYGTQMYYNKDATYFTKINEMYQVLGYTTNHMNYFIEENARDASIKSIFDEDSTYLRCMKWLFDMNQAGLINPDALTLDRSTVMNSQILQYGKGIYLMGMPDLPGWNHSGFYEVDFDDYYVAQSVLNPYGGAPLCINAKSENIEAALKYLDITASDDALMTLSNGPKGGSWVLDENGHAVLEEKYKAQLGTTDRFILPSGEEYVQYNTVFVYNKNNMSKTMGTYYALEYWPETLAVTSDTDAFREWQALTGFDTFYDQVKSEDRLINWTNYSAFLGVEPDDIKILRNSIKDVVVDGCWKMVFAADEAEFDAIWKQICEDAYALDYQTLYDYRLADIQNAKTTMGIE